MDLRSQLQECFRRRTCVVGIGSTEYGDDGFGAKLAQELAAAGMPDVVVAGSSPDRLLYSLTTGEYENILFLDALDFGADPGFVALINAAEIEAKFPQISTHKISLGILARMIEDGGKRRVWLIGVQPKSLAGGSELSPVVAATSRVLKELLLSAAACHAPVGSVA
jgi:hydrogenase 3 maturation protease